MGVVVLDITPLKRAQDRMNWACHAGNVAGGFFLLASLLDRRTLFVSVPFILSGYGVARGNRVAAAFQNVVLLAGLSYFLADYVGTPVSTRVDAASARLSVLVAACFAAAAAVTLTGWHAIATHRRFLPVRRVSLKSRIRRLRARVSSRKVWRAAGYLCLSMLFLLPVVGPGIVDMSALLFFHVPDPGLTDRVGEFVLRGPRLLWIPLILLGIAAIAGSVHFFTKAKRLASAGAAEMRARDPRPPVLLLRSFRDDLTPLKRAFHLRPRGSINLAEWTLEETVERALWSYGPVVAIGRPGEPLPPAGAAREYVAADAWRPRVQEWIGEARLIVVILGEGEGLLFEYRALVGSQALAKTILVFPSVPDETLRERWNVLQAVANTGLALPAFKDGRSPLVACSISDAQPRVVVCRWRDDEDCYRLALGAAVESCVG